MDLDPGLYLVATPIGNLGDFSRRAVEVLQASEVILAEDTRHAAKLCRRYGIEKPREAYHDFNKEKRTPEVLSRLQSGQIVSLISDAGTPGIADPGFYLVRAARREDIPVRVIPGPCAFVAALTLTSLPTDHFLFSNFPPKKSAQRLQQLTQYKQTFSGSFKWAPTVGYYIGPKQLKGFLENIREVFGQDLRVVLVREITKIYEEILDKTVEEHLSYYGERNPKGEFVLFFHPQNKGT